MITRDGLQYLMQLKDIEVVHHDELQYSSRPLHLIPEATPEPFETKSLAGLVELIKQEITHERLNGLIVHVSEPTQIEVHSMLRSDLGRFHVYSAVAELPRLISEQYADLETAIIRLKSTFVQTETRDELIKLLGNIKEENVRTSSDDGVSQTVAAKTGIATISNVTLPPIIKLIPYRTFIEVEQPESEFLLRLRNGPEVALFGADGGAWKIQARRNIKDYFINELKDLILDFDIIVTE